MQALRNQVRRDIGRFPSLSAEAVQALTTQYREHPGWTAQLHHDNLRVTLAAAGTKCPVVSERAPIPQSARAAASAPADAGSATGASPPAIGSNNAKSAATKSSTSCSCMHLDFHHGSRKVLTRSGAVRQAAPGRLHRRPLALPVPCPVVHERRHRRAGPRPVPGAAEGGTAAFADDRSGLGDDLRGVHRGACITWVFCICPRCRTRRTSTGSRKISGAASRGASSPCSKGEANLTLEQLNVATQAWVTQEYHRTVHSELGATPMQRYLAGPNVGRECPGSEELRAAFRIEVKRKQRRSDGTVSLDGQRFEIPSRYRRLDEIHLRYARWDFSRVDLIDARSGQILCPVRPLDKAANADALRRRVDPTTTRHERDAGHRHRAAPEENDRRLRRDRPAARLFTHRR